MEIPYNDKLKTVKAKAPALFYNFTRLRISGCKCKNGGKSLFTGDLLVFNK